MAEGSGGEAAGVSSFDDLTREASLVAQLIRAHLSPPGTTNTWLGPSSVLSDIIAGSVLLCESFEEGPFTAVVPPKAPSSSPVRRLRGVVSIRVSRDGSLSATRYEDLQSLHNIVKKIVPGVLTVGGYKGALADTVRLLESGDEVTLSASASSQSGGGPVFTVTAGRQVVIDSSSDIMSILGELSVRGVPWTEFARGEWWGLPPTNAPMASEPIRWQSDDDALSLATVFGLPPVSSSTDALQFLFGCCDTPSTLFSVHELAHGFAADASVEAREAVAALLSMVPVVTRSRPDVVDSVHSRLRALLQSPDAPEPFIAFGLAWRQGALEPPPRRQSRAASPSPSLPRRTMVSSPPGTQTRSALEEEVAALTPNTMRQKLIEALAERRSGATTTAAAPHTATATPVGHTTGRMSASRVQHSGQLGGLFARTGVPVLAPALTTAAETAEAQGPPTAARAFSRVHTAAPVPAPTPHVPSTGMVLQSISPTGGPAVATTVIVPEAYHHMPVTQVVTALVAHGMPDVVAQFAHASGDTIPATVGSAFEAISLLRHIEEVFADVHSAMPSFSFLDRPPARDWGEAVDAVQTLLSRYSSTFRAKRHCAERTSESATGGASDEKLPSGSYKQVSTATASERPGACDAQLIEEVASDAVIRREHVRGSLFCVPTSSQEERDSALHGELAHFRSTYGQAAIAYILSNGTVVTPLSGHGVPMALANVRLHLLAGVTRLIHSTMGFERALSMHAKCSSLAMSFLTGLTVVEDCVALLGGSAPHEDAEIRREGGATSTGTLGTTSGPNAQLSIREAFSLWGQGLHLVLGSIPGVPVSGTDFAVGAQLKKVPRELEDARLLSICRFMTSRVGVALSAYRTMRGEQLPDVVAIVTRATTAVFQERELDQRQHERAVAATAPLLARIQQLEAAQAKARPAKQESASAPTERKTRWGAPANAAKKPSRTATGAPAGSTSSPAVQQEAAQAASTSPAQEATQQFLASLQHTAPAAPTVGGPQSLLASSSSGSAPSHSGEERITSRLKALLELSALYREHVGMDPKGDPAQEPCAYRALFGECGHDDCVRCATNKSFPQHLVDAVKGRCDPKVFGGKSGTRQKGAKGAVKRQQSK